MKIISYRFLIISLLLGMLSSSFIFAGLSKESLKILVPSDNRYTVELGGSWDRTTDMNEWNAVTIPRSEKSDEKITYKRVINIPSGMTDNYSWQLYFLGIDHQIEVYWNEQFIGRYVGSMTPFNVRIPEKTVRNDANEIRLVLIPAEGKIKQIRSQQLNSRQYFTGIIRDIILIGTPQVWISDIKLNNKIKSSTSADIKAEISISSTEVKTLVNRLNSKDSLNLKYKDKILVNLSAELKKRGSSEILANASSKLITIESDRTIVEGLSLSASNINLWSPESPELYELHIKIKRSDLVIDDYVQVVGFRNIVTASSGKVSNLLMNGEPFKIKGISYVEDLKGTGQTMTEQQIKQDIELIKKLGANVVRNKFSPPHPLFDYYCNVRGLSLMIELPVYNVPSKITNLDEVRIHMQNMAKQFISKYNNSPSMFAWGIGSGVDENEKYYKNYCEQMIKLFSRDSEHLKYKIVPNGVENIYTDGFDLIGYSDLRKNIDYNVLNSEFKRIQELIDGKPLFMTYGTEIQMKNHNGYSDPLSIEFQAYNILNSYKIVEKNKGAGSVINTFNDYLQNKPSLTTNNDESYINTSGILDRARNERLSFSTLQALFNNEKEPLLNAGSFNQTMPVSYLVIGILLAILLVLLINRFRRFREYMFRSLLRPYNFYADIRDQRIISSVQTILLGLIISISVGIFLSSILYYFKDSEVLEYLLMLVLPSNSLKEFVYGLVWMPEVSMLFISFVTYMLAFLTAWIIRMIAILSRARIFWSDCLTISIWAALPSIILLPVSIILMRLMVMSPGSVWFFLFLYLLTSIWTVARLLKSISVVFDISSVRTYLIGGVLFAILIISPFGYYHIKYSFFEYWNYYVSVLLG